MATPTEIRNGDSLEFCTGIPDNNEPIESPIFSLVGKTWNFQFSRETIPGDTSDAYYRVVLKRENDAPFEFRSFKFDFYVGLKAEENFSLGNGTMEVRSTTISFEFWKYSENNLKSRLPSDYRTGNIIKFTFRFYLPSEPVLQFYFKSHDKSVQTPSYIDTCFGQDHTSKDFAKLLVDGPKHDVEITCGDQTIRAHKNVLCCRSEVFASMLHSDMLEGKTGRVDIKDIDATVFQQFLKSLYTGVLPVLTVDSAMQLYRVSDKYAVDTMKKQCAEYLIDNLSLTNACEILLLADQCSDLGLKERVVDYVLKEKVPIVAENWFEVCKVNPVLANEVYYLFCQHLCQK